MGTFCVSSCAAAHHFLLTTVVGWLVTTVASSAPHDRSFFAVCVAEAESMATARPAARNLCAAVTYTRVRETATLCRFFACTPTRRYQEKQRGQRKLRKHNKRKREGNTTYVGIWEVHLGRVAI